MRRVENRGARPSGRRDRRGRGMRGPGVVPRRPGRPELPTRRERFDDPALAIVTSIDKRPIGHGMPGPVTRQLMEMYENLVRNAPKEKSAAERGLAAGLA